MDFPDGFCCFVPSVKRPVNFTGVQFARHCNHVDVIPVLEWTQVSVALGDFVALCSIRDGSPGFSWFEVLLVMVTRMDVLCAFKLTFSWRY